MARLTVPPAGFIEPMLPTLVDAAPEGDAWIHEIKYDGYRTQLKIVGRDSRAYTRNGYDWTDRYGIVITAAKALKRPGVLRRRRPAWPLGHRLEARRQPIRQRPNEGLVKVKSFTVGDYAVLGVERSSTGIPVAFLTTLGRDPAYVGNAMVLRAAFLVSAATSA